MHCSNPRVPIPPHPPQALAHFPGVGHLKTNLNPVVRHLKSIRPKNTMVSYYMLQKPRKSRSVLNFFFHFYDFIHLITNQWALNTRNPGIIFWPYKINWNQYLSWSHFRYLQMGICLRHQSHYGELSIFFTPMVRNMLGINKIYLKCQKPRGMGTFGCIIIVMISFQLFIIIILKTFEVFSTKSLSYGMISTCW